MSKCAPFTYESKQVYKNVNKNFLCIFIIYCNQLKPKAVSMKTQMGSFKQNKMLIYRLLKKKSKIGKLTNVHNIRKNIL